MSEFRINPKIERAIKELKVARIEPTNIDGSFIITKSPTSSFIVGKNYKIKLDSTIIHPPSNMSLHTNWNNNQPPKYPCMTCEVTQIMGNMVKIKGCAYDVDNDTHINYWWEGWAPKDKITILEELH